MISTESSRQWRRLWITSGCGARSASAPDKLLDWPGLFNNIINMCIYFRWTSHACTSMLYARCRLHNDSFHEIFKGCTTFQYYYASPIKIYAFVQLSAKVYTAELELQFLACSKRRPAACPTLRLEIGISGVLGCRIHYNRISAMACRSLSLSLDIRVWGNGTSCRGRGIVHAFRKRRAPFVIHVQQHHGATDASVGGCCRGGPSLLHETRT